MKTVRQLIFERTRELLSATGTNVFVNRMSDVNDSQCPAYLLYEPSQNSNNRLAYNEVEHNMGMVVQGIVVSDDDELISGLINDLYANAVEALQAEGAYGDLIIDILEMGLEISVDERESGLASASFDLTFEVRYTTSIGDARSAPTIGG